MISHSENELTAHNLHQGEYGLPEAVTEIKECRKIVRARDREVEKLTDELNFLKLQLSEVMENNEELKQKIKSNESEFTIFLEKKPHVADKKTKQKIKTKEMEKPPGINKINQCQMSMISSKHLQELYDTHVQNEKLRLELKTVCEEAIESSIQLQKQHEQESFRNDDIIQNLNESLLTLKTTFINTKSIKPEHSTSNKTEKFHISDKHFTLTSGDCYQAVLNYVSKEDIAIQELFHELANQIKVLKNNQNIMIRRYITLADSEISLRKENQKLKKALYTKKRKNIDSYIYTDEEFKYQTISSRRVLPDDVEFLHKLLTTKESFEVCEQPFCLSNQVNMNKLLDLGGKLLKDISLSKKLLEIAHHQTQAVEAAYFSQEIEIRSLKNQFALFQVQSDEKMLLGKLAMKVLQLQFNKAACIYELKKYKLDKQALEEWHSALQKEYEESGRKFSELYLEAQEKVKALHEVLKDLCQRCNDALANFM